MKKILLAFSLLASWSLMAKTYECSIPASDLGRLGSSGMDLDFQVVSYANSGALSLLGDSVDEDCDKLGNILNCNDAEGMPYTVKILNDNEVTLTIGRGMYLPETKAQCTSF